VLATIGNNNNYYCHSDYYYKLLSPAFRSQSSFNDSSVSVEDAWSAFNVSTAQCLAGYSGVSCSTCSDGFYRLGNTCTACPKGAYMLMAGYAIAIAGFILLAFVAHRKRVNMSALGIGVDFLQVGAGFCRTVVCSVLRQLL
jgi:hypothetical protein